MTVQRWVVGDNVMVDAKDYDALAARLAAAERLLGMCLDEVEANADLWTEISVFLVPEDSEKTP